MQKNERLLELTESVISLLEKTKMYRDKLIKFKKALNRETPNTLPVSLIDDVFDQLNYAQIRFKAMGVSEPTATADLRKLIIDLLQSRFKVIELFSENQLTTKLKPFKKTLTPNVLNDIIKNLRKVHSTIYRPEKLDALLALQSCLAKSPTNPVLTTVADVTKKIIHIILNAQTHEEVKEKLLIRAMLQKYKPDFITMPPKKSHQGKLLRELLKYELLQNPNQKKAMLNYELIPHAMRYARFKNTPKITMENPRRAYLFLLVGYFYEALKKGNIRAINELNAKKEFVKGKHILHGRALESKRLYPFKGTKMMLSIVDHGYFKNKSLIASPFSTKGMYSTHFYPNTAIAIQATDGSYYADSASEKRVHSSLANAGPVCWGGYIGIKYGKIVECGTDDGSHKSSEQNQLNNLLHLVSIGAVDIEEDPAFFVDHQHSPELAIYAKTFFPGAMRDNHSQFKINRYALNLQNAYLNANEPYLDQPPLAKISLVRLMQHNALLRKRVHGFTWLNRDDIRIKNLTHIICEMIKFDLKKYGILIPRGYQIELFKRRHLALGIGYKIVKIPSYRVVNHDENFHYLNVAHHAFSDGYKQPVLRNGTFPTYNMGYTANTIYCRELDRFLDANEQINNAYNLENFFTSVVYRNNAKKRKHQIIEKLIANRFVGLFSATAVLLIISPIFFSVIFNLLSPAIIFGIIALSAASSSILNAITLSKQKKEHSQDSFWGWQTMFIFASLFFMIATFTFITVSSLHILGTLIAIGFLGFSLASLAIPVGISAGIKHFQTHNKKHGLVDPINTQYRQRNTQLHNKERLDACARKTFKIFQHHERFKRMHPSPAKPSRPEAKESSAKKRLVF